MIPPPLSPSQITLDSPFQSPIHPSTNYTWITIANPTPPPLSAQTPPPCQLLYVKIPHKLLLQYFSIQIGHLLFNPEIFCFDLIEISRIKLCVSMSFKYLSMDVISMNVFFTNITYHFVLTVPSVSLLFSCYPSSYYPYSFHLRTCHMFSFENMSYVYFWEHVILCYQSTVVQSSKTYHSPRSYQLQWTLCCFTLV